MDLSVIIVNYNTKILLERCLDSINKFPPVGGYEVFVVDNASTDGSIEYLNNLDQPNNVILNKDNAGFSKANNQAISKAKGRYILLLNPDTEVLVDTLDKCIDYMDKHDDIGILGCKVMLPNGKLDLACRRGFPNLRNSFFKFTGFAKAFPKIKLFSGYNLTYLDEHKSYPVDSVVGAFMMLRRETIEEIGLLDEEFFMYGEDIDWCYRAKQAGWQVFYYADASIIHHKRASSKQNPKALVEFFRAMKVYYRKHHANKHNKFINEFVYASIDLLAYLKIFINRFKK
ncbi:glycosyltransferase family 2 protein [Petroclostridium sp. X23]|uniref:glycosyltransferase family 2 protein n=1 Tax=Petroclostridium sp. X23 TaxID=3045146 RepID=UPI0024AC98EA|nr:glycosyltransferase family 2 protein [Petroclostridium sp. X23]WHH57424.1 glycosyltransferase family 2 protein [Petroclostridium sp. X23]